MTPPLCRCVSAGSCVAQFFTSSSAAGRIYSLFCFTEHRQNLLFLPQMFLFFPPSPSSRPQTVARTRTSDLGDVISNNPHHNHRGGAPALPTSQAVSVQASWQGHGEPLLLKNASFGTGGSCEGNHCSHVLGLRSARLPLNPAPFLLLGAGERGKRGVVFRK